MKKSILATAALLVIVGSASASDRSGISEGRTIFHSSHDDFTQSYNASNSTRAQTPNVQSRPPAKTRNQVMQELQEHQARMRTDHRYAEEWRLMYEN